MTVENIKVHPKRRKGPDLWVKLVGWVGVISWFLFFIAVFLISRASPDDKSYVSFLYDVKLRQYWNMTLAQYAFITLIILLLLTLIAFIANIKRNRRATDRLNISVVLSLAFSVIGIILYIVYI